MSNKVVTIIIYCLKCIIGILCAYAITNFFNLTDIATWCLLSVLLVLAPDSQDSYKLALTRIKANLVAAVVGLLILTVYTPGILWVIIGVILAIIFCYLFRIETGARSASVAIIIILMHEEGHHWWGSAVNRIEGVVLGCLIGVAITVVFHYFELKREKKLQPNEKDPDHTDG